MSTDAAKIQTKKRLEADAGGASSAKKAEAPKRKTTKKASTPKTTKKKVAANPANPVAVGREEIALRAWQIWQEDGCPQGQEVEHWLRAEQELLAT